MYLLLQAITHRLRDTLKMAEEEKKRYLEDIATLRYADVAQRMGSDPNAKPFVMGALEKLVSDVAKTVGGDKAYLLEGLEKGTLASEKGVATATAIYSKIYKDAFGKLNFSEYYGLRLKQLTSILGKEKAEKAKDAFAKYEGQTLGSVMKKYEQAVAILEDDKDLFDEKKKEEAKKTKEKLEGLYQIISSVELWNYWDLMPGAAKNLLKEHLSDALDKAGI